MNSFTISIDQFQGPLDLMLHLIKEKQLDLFDLDLDVLADQYISYITTMEDMHLEIASEYLAELAGLLEYKSRKLLPKDTSELDDHYEEDTKEKMVQRLLEYDRFQRITSEFEKRYQDRMLLMDKPQEIVVNDWLNQQEQLAEESVKGNPYDLIKAMDRVIKRFHIMQPLPTKVARKEFSIEDRNVEIRERIKTLQGTFTIDVLCEDCETMDRFIVTFLSVLDLIHHGELVAVLDDEETIWLEKGVPIYDRTNE